MCDLRIPINYRLQDLSIFMHFSCNSGQDTPENVESTTLNSRVELKFLKLVLLLYQAGNIVCNHHAKYFTKILTNKQGKWVSKTENFSVIN